MADRSSRIALVLALFLPVSNLFGDVPLFAPKVGDEYKISNSYETSSKTDDGSSGSSRGSTTIVVRVVGAREDGLELEYDLPNDTSAADRARSWQFPVHVFKPSRGPMQLLNRPELEARVDAWLQEFGMTREACGRWTFTWNAFRIECDPESVIEMLNSYDLSVERLSDGAPYEDPEAISPGMLRKNATGENRETFAVTLQIDPEAVRRARAESDVVVGELMNEPLTLEEALGKRALEVTSGTILVTLEADSMGNVWRRTRVAELETKLVNGQYERQTATETVERHRIQEPSVSQ
jgi:hypothetical protein